MCPAALVNSVPLSRINLDTKHGMHPYVPNLYLGDLHR